ncbi:MAG: hypothetical protein Tsb009_24550 [Planctomycetaceae bacterium]
MSRRHRTANSVSLFPFLAVLVCAMGALILLLIVTTRRIRSEALAKATPQPVKSTAEIDVPAPPAPVIAQTPPKLPELPPVIPAPMVSEPPLEPPKPQIDPNIALTQRLRELSSEQARRKQAVDQLAQQLKQRKKRIDNANALLSSLNSQHSKAQQLVISLQNDARKTNSLIAKAQTEKGTLAQGIQKAKEDYARASSEFAIIPFEGNSGTTRRPIYIECTAKSFRFLPENIELQAGDFRGFSPAYNPLLAATRNLIKHWAAKSRTQGEEKAPKPYVLLLVRPSGNTAFYVARKFLSQLNANIGYELIDEDWKLAMPAVDEQAKSVCQAGINEALQRRKNAVAALVNQGLPASAQGRSIRFHRGTGRLEVLEPGETSTAGTGGTGRVPRSAADRKWQNVLNGNSKFSGGSSRRNGSASGTSRFPQTANGHPGKSRNTRGSFPRGTSRFGSSSGKTGSENRFTTPGGMAERKPHGSGNNPRDTFRSGQIGSPNGNPDGFAKPENGSTVGPFGSNRVFSPENSFSGNGSGGLSSSNSLSGNPNSRSDNGKQNGQPGSPNGTSENGPLGKRGQGPGQGQNSQGNRGTSKNLAGGSRSENPFGRSFGTGSAANGGTSSFHQGTTGSRTSSSGFGSASRFRSFRARKRRWGFSSPSATIGFEREIVIRAGADRLIVGKTQTIKVGRGETRSQLLNSVEQAIERQARSWGKPPTSFYWVPRIRFVVSPGGNQYYERLKDGMRKLQLQSSVEYKLASPPVLRSREVPR